jgi:hypothetical protein
MTMAQTLEVVYGLMNNVKVVINGTKSSELIMDVQMIVLKDGKASVDGIWKALGKLLPCSGISAHKLMMTADMMQQIANDINKMKR